MKSNVFHNLSGRGFRIAVVHARFNADVTSKLLAGCLRALAETGVRSSTIHVVEVPGSFELPFMIAHLLRRKRYDAAIAIGAIIKGDTDHDVHIARAVSLGIGLVSRQYDVPVIFGVLTTRNKRQALERARGLGARNKGYEAGMSAVEMALAVRNQTTK